MESENRWAPTGPYDRQQPNTVTSIPLAAGSLSRFFPFKVNYRIPPSVLTFYSFNCRLVCDGQAWRHSCCSYYPRHCRLRLDTREWQASPNFVLELHHGRYYPQAVTSDSVGLFLYPVIWSGRFKTDYHYIGTLPSTVQSMQSYETCNRN